MSSASGLQLLLREYLNFCGIKPSSQQLQLVSQSSPSYPSVLSIVQTCVYFGLKTKAYKADYDALLKNNMPAIVHLKEGSDEKFVLVVKVTDKHVVYKDAGKLKTVEVSAEKFTEEWTGILILSEKNEEKKVKKHSFVKKYGIYSLFLFVVFTAVSYNPQNITFFIVGLFFLKSVGIWLT